MSRRGGTRRQVLQLGDSSKLHRYGYTKGFQSKEGTVQGPALTNLVGDYSDSDSDDSNSNSNDPTTSDNPQPPIPDKEEEGEGLNDKTPPAVPQEAPASVVVGDGGEDPMDDELRNFLSEIEAIPMPDESKTPDRISDGAPSPTPTSQTNADASADEPYGSTAATTASEKTTATTSAATKDSGPSKKSTKSGAYSMFVKGDVEFAHSPSSVSLDGNEPQSSEKTVKEESREKASSDLMDDLPTEPTTEWQMVQDENTQYYYYWNWRTNQVTWEIPSDYTQYLLLHKEYQAKRAKLSPQQLQALKDRKAGNGLSITLKEGNNKSKTVLGESSITGIDSYKTSEEENDRPSSHHYHHKKKKSKKHKRRHEDSSDEETNDRHGRKEGPAESVSSSKSLAKSKNSKTIGPQPLSIVPYMSDEDNEDDDDNSKEDKKETVKMEDDIASRLESETSTVHQAPLEGKDSHQSNKSRSSSLSPTPVSVSEKTNSPPAPHHEKADFDSLVQDLVEMHDTINPPNSSCASELDAVIVTATNSEEIEKSIISNADDVIREVTGTKERSPNDYETQMETEDKINDLDPNNDKNENLIEHEVKMEEGSVKETKEDVATEQANNGVSSLKDKERENIFEQFAVKTETKKKKKKAINMFAEDSQSEIDDEKMIDDGGDDDDNPEVDDKVDLGTTKKKIEVEEGEISDGSESLQKPIRSKDNHKNEKKRRSGLSSLKEKSATSEKSSVSAMKKSVVGYSEEEEEEGELKEEDKSVRKPKETKTKSLSETEKTDEAKEPKKRVLQYKDYMKKYRAGKSVTATVADIDKADTNTDTVIKEAMNVNSSANDSNVPGETCVGNKEEEVGEGDKKSEAVQEPVTVTVNIPAEEKMNSVVKVKEDEEEEEDGEKKEEEKKEDKEEEELEDMDLDDLDNIDRVLEMALVKKRDQKTESKQDADVQKSIEVSKTSSLAETDSKVKVKDGSECVESLVEGPTISDTDMQRLKYSVKDSAELALNKLQFLDISTKNLSKLQVLLVELQTRYSDWQAGGLSTPYFHQQLHSSQALLAQYEQSAVPSGWLCQWDRASCRYFYRNKDSGHTQWEYPQTESTTTSSSTTTTAAAPTSSSSSKVKGGGGGEVKESSSSGRRSGKKRRSKEKEEREKERDSSSKSRGSNLGSSRSSRSHRSSKKGSEKERGKRDRHSSSSHHHRKKKRRRRDHSSSSSSSGEDESTTTSATTTTQSRSSHHRHSRSKRKKRSRSEKSPSLEVIDLDGSEHAHVIEESPPRLVNQQPDQPPVLHEIDVSDDDDEYNDDDDGGPPQLPKTQATAKDLVADYGSEQDMDDDDDDDDNDDDDEKKRKKLMKMLEEEEERENNELDGQEMTDVDGTTANSHNFQAQEEDIDGVAIDNENGEEKGGLKKDEEEDNGEEDEKEEEVNSAVIIKPPQIMVPPYVAAINQPQLYSAPTLYTSSSAVSSSYASSSSLSIAAPPVGVDQDTQQQGETTATTTTAVMTSASRTSEEAEKATSKKKKKDKSGKEKSLNANSSIMMKKKRVSSMVQKWQQVKKEVEKENRDKELKQAAIREKINQLKST